VFCDSVEGKLLNGWWKEAVSVARWAWSISAIFCPSEPCWHRCCKICRYRRGFYSYVCLLYATSVQVSITAHMKIGTAGRTAEQVSADDHSGYLASGVLSPQPVNE